ncbi:hypothetical protein MetMK1DRAFT_00028280 [Metallosphaera yellowstonensis MK1]|uniref:Uncharacterized protein n=1 Tax=Metallosphaera yellowstonensis MK1 TaxID=671065 RepID=H2C8C0_9CREN|nr:hypothetical protein MetMK1DRAFT_00028280 [Metallosphaera yellowstonensis MK1]
MVELVLERSKSLTGKHAVRTFLFKWDGKPIEVKFTGTKIPPTYKNGESYLLALKEKGSFVYIRLLMNLRGRVKGKIMVIKDGNIALELSYRKLKIKRVSGDPALFELVKPIIEMLKIPTKKVNLR